MNLAELNETFGLAEQLKFVQGRGGQIEAQLENQWGETAVSLFGGHVLSFQPKGQKPVLWLSQHAIFDAKTPIRGGVPIIWPWFGSHPTDSSLPAHGFARRSLWQVRETAVLPHATRLLLGLSDNEQTRAIWPHPFDLSLEILAGETLTLTLISTNKGDAPFTYGAALHSYFTVGDIGQTAVYGLDGVVYIDQLADNQHNIQAGNITFSAETDNIYLHTPHTTIIEDDLNQREIIIEKAGSLSTVVWNPWLEKAKRMQDFGDEEFQEMVCVETANAAEDVRTLEAGAVGQLTAVIRSSPQ